LLDLERKVPAHAGWWHGDLDGAEDRWFVDETYVRVAGRWTYLSQAIDQHGRVIDVLVSGHRDAAAARRCLAGALRCGRAPVDVSTDRAQVYLRVI
jgi:transposase-like protein